jgi:hypothetical protein
MAHVPTTDIHAYRLRALELTVDVDTDADAADLSAIVFEAGDVEKTGLTATDGGTGVLIEVSLTGADLNMDSGIYPWECRATIGGQVRTLARGLLRLSPEPTPVA